LQAFRILFHLLCALCFLGLAILGNLHGDLTVTMIGYAGSVVFASLCSFACMYE
jgi:hypothetical protein